MSATRTGIVIDPAKHDNLIGVRGFRGRSSSVKNSHTLSCDNIRKMVSFKRPKVGMLLKLHTNLWEAVLQFSNHGHLTLSPCLSFKGEGEGSLYSHWVIRR